MKKCPKCNLYIPYSNLMFTDRYLCECPSCGKESHLDDFKYIEFRVLTLWQPWASLLVHGIKKIETRPKPTSWTHEKGIYLIHAASKWTKDQKEICMKEPFRSELIKLRYLVDFIDPDTKEVIWVPMFPKGMIIGSVEVTECCKVIERHPILEYCQIERENFLKFGVVSPEYDFGNYGLGRSAWLCENPRVLRNPIPYSGGQGYYQKFKGDHSKLIFV